MKNGTILVLVMVVVAAAAGLWARFHRMDHAPVELGPGAKMHVKVTKEARLSVKGSFSGQGTLDVDLVVGEKVSEVAKDWKGHPLDILIPAEGGLLRITNRAANPGSLVRGRVQWTKVEGG